jgi:hypothetical protein
MEIHNNDITCYRGESFTLDFDVRNQDGSPFVLWSGYNESGDQLLKDPYILFKISSDNSKDDDIVYKYWLNCNKLSGELDDLFPRFDITVPQILPSSLIYDDDKGTLPENHYPRKCVYKIENTDRYVYVKDIDDENVCTFADYNFRIAIPLSSDDTESLLKMNYTYSMMLTDGKVSDYKILMVLLAPHTFTVLNPYRR